MPICAESVVKHQPTKLCVCVCSGCVCHPRVVTELRQWTVSGQYGMLLRGNTLSRRRRVLECASRVVGRCMRHLSAAVSVCLSVCRACVCVCRASFHDSRLTPTRVASPRVATVCPPPLPLNTIDARRNFS